MNKILISVFDSEEAAYEGVRALKDLHREGDVTMYASAVIAKDDHGHVAIRQAADRGPVGTLVGTVTGGLVGLLGGPVGAAVGAYVGGTGGFMYDLFAAGFGIDVLDEVSDALTPGRAAVVADVDETWVTPVETRLGALGGTTFRRLSGEVLDEQLAREAQDARAELEELKAELHEASGEAKAKVQTAIDHQKRKLEGLVARVDTAIDEDKAVIESKLTTLRAQFDAARGRQKERIEKRITALKTAHETRKTKLQQARQLAKQALELTREAVAA